MATQADIIFAEMLASASLFWVWYTGSTLVESIAIDSSEISYADDLGNASALPTNNLVITKVFTESQVNPPTGSSLTSFEIATNGRVVRSVALTNPIPKDNSMRIRDQVTIRISAMEV